MIIFSKKIKLKGSQFAVNYSIDNHTHTTWRILNEDDSVFFETETTSNLTEIIFDLPFLPDTVYKAQVKYKGEYAVYSSFSNPIYFQLEWIDTPSIISIQTSPTLKILTSYYQFNGALNDPPNKSILKIAKASSPDEVLYEYKVPYSNEIEISDLLDPDTYVCWVQYYGNVAVSEPSEKSQFIIT